MNHDILQCNLCLVPCPSRNELHGHLIVHYKSLQEDLHTVVGQLSGFLGSQFTNVVNNISKAFRCTCCTSSFDTKTDLLRHGASHHRRFVKCPTCSNDFVGAFKFLYNHQCVKDRRDEEVQRIRDSLRQEIETLMGQYSPDHVVRSYKRKKRRTGPTQPSCDVLPNECSVEPTRPSEQFNMQMRDEYTIASHNELPRTAIPEESMELRPSHMQLGHHNTGLANDSQDTPLSPTATAETGLALESFNPWPDPCAMPEPASDSNVPSYSGRLFRRAKAPSSIPFWNQFDNEYHGSVETVEGVGFTSLGMPH